ncbi:MAG: putative transrane protein [Rhizobium sp.]|nr:putative transrane protein [Rhizobium sp.]
MTEFTPWMSIAGGLLIGLSAVLLMAFHGRIAGLSGVLGGLLPPFSIDWQWRVAFLAGAVIGPAIFMAITGPIEFSIPAGPAALAIGGVIVGIGVTLGNGCPSGHGVCGMARLSPRSFVATLSFIATALVTVFLIRHVF